MPRERQEGNERLRSLLAGAELPMGVLTPRFLWKLPPVSPSPPAGCQLGQTSWGSRKPSADLGALASPRPGPAARSP